MFVYLPQQYILHSLSFHTPYLQFMKNIYNLFKMGIVMLMLVSITARACTPPSSSSPKYTLYPPTNLNIIVMELCAAYLTWDKPHDPGGLTPAGLIGYKIYRDGILIHSINDPDSLEYYDYVDDVGTFTDSVTAYYDLTSYGFPGDFGESAAESGIITVYCAEILPMFESWDGGSFSYQNWSFSPVQGNWHYNTIQGNPTPTASFMGTPAVTNYSNRLQSINLDCSVWICANIYLEFDSRLILNNATSLEKMITEIQYNGIWYPKDTLVNDANTGWTHHKIDISDATGKYSKIGFRATGTNSSDIVEWDIDNIHVYPVCFRPPDFSLERTGHQVNLSWGIPCNAKKFNSDHYDRSSIAGYNIYRTDQSGLPPFNKINASYVADTSFTDILPQSFIGEACYFVTVVYQDSANPGYLLCEPPSDTLCADFLAGIQNDDNSRLHIFPNPVNDFLKIESSEPLSDIEILNFTGQKIYSESFPGRTNISIRMKDYPGGIYLVKLKVNDKIIVRKIINN